MPDEDENDQPVAAVQDGTLETPGNTGGEATSPQARSKELRTTVR